jgi:hypothetical protein
MAGYIAEFFGYKAGDTSDAALLVAAKRLCPFLNSPCTKILSRDHDVSGVCAVKQKADNAPSVICCPIRLYADDYKMLKIIANDAFKQHLNLYAGRVAIEKAKTENGAVAVFGHGWGGELRLPQRKGKGSYFVDWVLAQLDNSGELAEFTAIEVQTIDTTGNYRTARQNLLSNRSIVSDTVGLNWENVSKRIIPQIIYKGQVLQREELCKTGLYFVCPQPVYHRILNRLGGVEKLPKFPVQPASIHFISYDYEKSNETANGKTQPLGVLSEHCTTVYKIQEAFSALDLPEGNVYRNAIRRSLYH